MSFCFQWPEFDEGFVSTAREELEVALNRGAKPSNICDTIRVLKLSMGSEPPELDILEIGELSEERFRGIFRIAYAGDAQVTLQTKVQANPLTSCSADSGADSITLTGLMGPTMVAADAPLIVPLELRISQVRIRGIFVLIVSLARGVTISFKNEPLESVQVNSTFDTMPPIRNHLQREIEQRLADLFREDLPLLLHHHSLGRIRRLAERIPPAFRSTPPFSSSPTGQFKHRRAQSASVPSRAESPFNNNSHQGAVSKTPESPSTSPGGGLEFNEIYYYRRNSMIHRVTSGNSICDPLATPTITDLQPHPKPVREEIERIWRRFTAGASQENFSKSDATEKNGLNDPILFKSAPSHSAPHRPRFGSQTLIINSGALQLEIPADTVERMRDTDVIRNPSVYKAPRSRKLGDEDDGADGRSLSALDPEEFRSVDSLLLRSYGNIVKPSKTLRSAMIPFGAAALSKSVMKSSLEGTLRILRSLQELPSPFIFTEERAHMNNIVHRSQSHPHQ